MAYRKFDEPNINVDQSGRKVYATPVEKFRRAIQGIANRVIGGTAGTGYVPVLAGLTDGGTGGVKIANTVAVIINGIFSTCVVQDNLKMPAVTMAANTVAKFLVCTAAGTSGTVIGPGNVVSKADYANATLAAAAAQLPDLPDGYCALGMLTLNAPAASAIVLASCGKPGTAGTAAYQDLGCMPYNA